MKIGQVVLGIFLIYLVACSASNASSDACQLSKVQAVQLMGICEILADEDNSLVKIVRVMEPCSEDSSEQSGLCAYEIRLNDTQSYTFWLRDAIVVQTIVSEDLPVFLSASQVDGLIQALRMARAINDRPPASRPEDKQIRRYANAIDPIEWLEEHLSELVGVTQLCIRERDGRWVILTGSRTGYEVRFADASYEYDRAGRAVSRVEGTDCVILRHIHGQELSAFCERLDDLFASQSPGVLEFGRGPRPLTDQEMREVRAP